MAVGGDVQKPVPILLGHVTLQKEEVSTRRGRHKSREFYHARQTRQNACHGSGPGSQGRLEGASLRKPSHSRALDRGGQLDIRSLAKNTIHTETSVVKNKVDTARLLPRADALPNAGEVVSKDVLLGGSQVVTSSGLKLLDVLLGHCRKTRFFFQTDNQETRKHKRQRTVNQQRQIGRVTPQADLSELFEEKLLSLLGFFRRGVGRRSKRGSEARGELENSLGGAAEGFTLLAEKDIIILPVFREGEALVHAWKKSQSG